MKLSKLKIQDDQSLEEMRACGDIQLFSDDLTEFGGERIIESKLLFHGAFAAKEMVEKAQNWDLRFQVVHLGDFWAGYRTYIPPPYRTGGPPAKAARVGFVNFFHDEPNWNSFTPNDYVEETGKSAGHSINNNVIAIKTENFVVVLYRHWGMNESRQYPEALREIDNELNILRTGSYSVYRLPVKMWQEIIAAKFFEEFSKFLKSEYRVIGGWQGFGNIA